MYRTLAGIALALATVACFPENTDQGSAGDSSKELEALRLELDELKATVATLQSQVDSNSASSDGNATMLATIQSDLSGAYDLMPYLSVDSSTDSVVFQGANVYVRDGSGTTDGDPNGLGNLVLGYDENDGGDWDNTSEAYGDVVSMLASRESCFGPGLFLDGSTCTGYGDTCLTCTGFRDHDWAARILNTPATPQDFVANRCMDPPVAGGRAEAGCEGRNLYHGHRCPALERVDQRRFPLHLIGVIAHRDDDSSFDAYENVNAAKDNPQVVHQLSKQLHDLVAKRLPPA